MRFSNCDHYSPAFIHPPHRPLQVYSTQATPSPQASGATVRRLHNNSLLSPHTAAAAVSSSPRILKQTTISRPVTAPTNTVYTLPQSTVVSLNSQPMKCYVCDSICGAAGSRLMDTCTASSQTKLPNKIGRVIGDAFLVIVRADDVVCKRCVSLFNQFDQAETTMDLVKTQLMGFICKKYAIDGDDVKAPAAKMQKMNSGLAVDASPPAAATTAVVRLGSTAGSATATVPSSPNATTRKVQVKVYKCMSCEFTTNDLKQFTPHYAVCPGVVAENNSQQQQPGSQNCSNSSTLTATSQTSVTNHSGGGSSSGSPSQSTVSPASKVLARRPVTQSLQQAKAAESHPVVVIYSCNLCSFKNRDKATYDEHMRRHIKVKPFKCRICSTRFETRETASKHARAHQTEYYKCGTCSIAYRDRDQLIKHFEVHRNDGTGGQQIIIKGSATAGQKGVAGAGAAAATAAAGQTASVASTQKLLQETIDEACSDAAAEVDAKNIHFFSCSICSLTFIQENYYNQHMETHKRDTNTVAPTTTTATKKFLQKAPNQVSIAAASTPVTKQMARNQKTTNGQSLIKTEVSRGEEMS